MVLELIDIISPYITKGRIYVYIIYGISVYISTNPNLSIYIYSTFYTGANLYRLTCSRYCIKYMNYNNNILTIIIYIYYDN